MIRGLLFLVALLLGGCTTANIGPDYTLANKPATGVLVLSMTYTPDAPLFNLNYRRKGTRDDLIFASNSVSTPEDWKKPAGRLVVVELPAGEYEIFQWGSSVPGAGLTSQKQFSVPFTLIAGKATYIGNVHIDVNYPGAPYPGAPGTYKISVTDKSDRDLELFFRRYKGIGQSELVSSIAAVATP